MDVAVIHSNAAHDHCQEVTSQIPPKSCQEDTADQLPHESVIVTAKAEPQANFLVTTLATDGSCGLAGMLVDREKAYSSPLPSLNQIIEIEPSWSQNTMLPDDNKDTACSSKPELEAITRVDISVKGLTMSVPAATKYLEKTKKTFADKLLLNDITFKIPAGSLMAIMGGSGSGKTSLLTILAGRTPRNIKTDGKILFNNQSPQVFIDCGEVAFVRQEDSLLPYLTVRSTLRFAARLRLPKSMPLLEKYSMVENVINELGLADCAETRIGCESQKGISGGERRRVSIGVQLLVNPAVIFMDEPTTGLDAHSAYMLICTLSHLCDKGHTIVISIHQPRADIFKKFDNITLLSRGKVAYSGPTELAIPYFEWLGFPSKANMNDADFLLDKTIINDRTEESEEISQNHVDRILSAWSHRVTSMENETDNNTFSLNLESLSGDAEISRSIGGAGFFEQIFILTHRYILSLWNDPFMLWGSLLEVLLMSLALGTIFFRLEESQSGILGRKSILFAIISIQNYTILLVTIYKTSSELKVFDRDRSDGMYNATAYVLAWFGVQIALYAVLATIFSCIIYFLAGMRTDQLFFSFGLFLLNTFLLHICSIAFAFLCLSLNRDMVVAFIFGNLGWMHMTLASGFFIPINSIPVYLRWIKHISYLTYGYRVYISLEFSDRLFSCYKSDSLVGDDSCKGNNIIASIDFMPNDYVYPFCFLILAITLKIVVSCLLLSFFPDDGAKAATYVGKESTQMICYDYMPISKQETPKISITLSQYSLKLSKRDLLTRNVTSKTILQNVSTTFHHGKITAILGASGSGKSTLLNALYSHRPGLTAMVTQIVEGSILFNGAKLSENEVAACSAYVQQDDSYLFPALTTRETLRHAALLRLPSAWSKERKLQRADEVLIELGLKNCADTLIGGPDLKGISGGERRRVSIGIALLADPAILLLDEPTSGLDSATTFALIRTLKNIAASGRTVIFSVHQPRPDVVSLFDRIFLLASGGRLIYDGEASEILSYFESVQLPCPVHSNPADFAIDISTVGLRDIDSQERVNRLFELWSCKTKQEQNELTTSEFNMIGHIPSQLPIHLSLPVLISRSFLNLKRQPSVLSARLMQALFFLSTLAIYYAPLKNDQASIPIRIGILQTFAMMTLYGFWANMAHFPSELRLYKTERQTGSYSIESFFLCYFFIELPFDILVGLWLAIVFVLIVGMKMNFIFVSFIGFAFLHAGESISITACALVNHFGFNAQILSTIIGIFTYLQGFYSVDMPQFLNYINTVSIFYYAARAEASLAFHDVQFTCSPQDSSCPYQTGDDIMALLKFDSSRHGFWMNVTGVVVCLVVYRLLAYVSMKVMLGSDMKK